MFLRIWRFMTIMLASLLMTMGFAHLWQLPPRMSYDGPFWFTTLSMYQQFGPQGPGPFLETGAILTAVVLVFLVHGRAPAFGLSLVATICLIIAFVAWWVFIYPVNVEMLNWTAQSLPTDSMQYRVQWEYTHAARAILMLIALGALVLSVLAETTTARARNA